MSVDESVVVSLWVESLQAAYALARGERLNELRGEYVRRFDARGVHPFSGAWGGVEAAQALVPELGVEHVATNAAALWKTARADADGAFRAEILGEAV